MAIPSQDTIAVGGKAQAAWANDDVRDAINFLISPPRAHVYNSAGVTLTTGTTTLIPLDAIAEQYDTDTMHSPSTNPSRVIATTAGLYTVNAQITYPSNATSWRYLMLRKNAAGAIAGGTLVWQGFVAGLATSANVIGVSVDVQMSATDYLELFGSQNSGGNLTTVGGAFSTYMQMRWVASS